MDTGTHFVMGIALGGMATIDPIVIDGSVTAQAVIIGTILGSQIPDVDTVLKLRNNAVYIRNHRGITHSIPAVMLWPILISTFIISFLSEANLLHLWLWTFLAVFLHVFVDVFNAYGTQAFRPITKRWIALGVINTFDPFIFGFHVIGLTLWGFGFKPGLLFLIMYSVIVLYYLARFRERSLVKKNVRQKLPKARTIILSPTMRFRRWKIAVMTDTKYYVAYAQNGQITILDIFDRIPVPDSDVINAAKKDVNLSAFLSFSPIYRWEIEELEEYYAVRFIDLRYRSNGFYPFVAVVHLDHDLNILNSYTGWIFSEAKLQKKLNVIL